MTATRVNVPPGFTSGWLCSRCGKPCPTIPEDLDAAQARCPHCRHWTAVWIPPEDAHVPERNVSYTPGPDHKRPKDARGKELFDHMRHVIENPALEPDLRKIDAENYPR